MSPPSIPEVQPAEEILPVLSVSREIPPGGRRAGATLHGVWRWLGFLLGWCWRILVGGLLCFNLLGGIVVTGWTYRWMQGLVLRGWRKKSRLREQGSFEDFCVSLGFDAPVARPRWFMQERMTSSLNRPDAFGRRPSAIRKTLRMLRLPWNSLWVNFKIGLQGLFCTFLLTGLGTLIMLFSWEFGWLNSFNKGYEQAFIGPLTGLLGVFIFIATMFYVPMAQVHQAVTGDYRAFFDIRFVWRLIRARLSVYVFLAALIVLVSLPLEILKTAPVAFDGFIDSWTNASDAEFHQMLQRYFLIGSLVLFFSILAWRWLAARIYQSAVLKVLERGWVTRAELHPTLAQWLDRLGVFPVPSLETAGITYVVKSGSRMVYRRLLFVLLFFIWFGFVAKVYVGEFLNYHPGQGLLNHPVIQLPYFNYVPSDLKP
ncbi:MAG TPA: DUF4013 domain-containing protein [Gemmataceae bacterium]|jgi:hypothetical protein|nr:DUF4013 domain-containing protein [Gemmataceae bacterium]